MFFIAFSLTLHGFSFLCSRLALLCFAKIGGGSAKKMKILRLLHKTGCGSEKAFKKTYVFYCLFSHLARLFFSLLSPCTTLLREDRRRLGKENENPAAFLFFALALHYLCTRL